MKIKTDSGNVTINKRSAYGKWLQGYVSTGAFSGVHMLRHCWYNSQVIKRQCPSVSWHDLGVLVGICCLQNTSI